MRSASVSRKELAEPVFLSFLSSERSLVSLRGLSRRLLLTYSKIHPTAPQAFLPVVTFAMWAKPASRN